MSIIDKIKLSKDETFRPNCSPDQEASEDGRIVLNCNPKLTVGNKVFGGDRPTKIILERGEKATVVDDGGAPTQVLEKLFQWLEKRMV